GRPLKPLDPNASSAARLGAEIRSRRLERGLTLEALAELIDFTPQHVSEVELANASVSRPFVAACDRALDAGGSLLELLPAVVYERALERHDRSVARRRVRRSRVAHERRELPGTRADGTTDAENRVMAELRRVLLCRYERAQPNGEKPDDATLQRGVVACWKLRQQGRYLDLGGMLTKLLGGLDAAVRAGAHDEGAALRLSVHAYNAASSVCKTLGDPGLAVLCADRAVQAARAVDEPLLVAAAAYRLANVYLSSGNLPEAHEIALSGASVIESATDASRARLATAGGLLLTAAVARARQQDARGAWELIRDADLAAARLGSEHVGLHTIFGPTSVAIYAVAVAAELGDGRDVVRRAHDIHLMRLPAGLLERRSHFLIEVARGHSQQANDREALATLLWAERLTPHEVRLNWKARALVEELTTRARPGAARELRDLAARVCVDG
ncbi:MAG: helix-turn-helix transcriptional regulator, partial [Actinobacteria bacterium]|nr:helix-turn-helix transcriptional regulator [Actinomycetota bacterium]